MSPSHPADRGGRRALRETLLRRGLRAHKARGQNFLVDQRVAEEIVARANLPDDTAVIEIGPGLGILTRALADRARRVVAIEIDRGLVATLRVEGGLPDHVELVHRDALQVNLPGLIADLGAPVQVVANLPYSISAPLLRWLLNGREGLQRWVVMLQREVAERLSAPVGTKSYSSISALYQAMVDTERLMSVPSASFDPVPKVESVVVRCTPVRPSPLEANEVDPLEALVRSAFSARRKTVVNALRGSWPWGDPPSREALEAHLARVGVAPRDRAEVITPRQFIALMRSLRGPKIA